jgi:hypothetical protein
LRCRGDPCPLEKPRPYHVIRVPIGLPAGVLDSELPCVLIKITRANFPSNIIPIAIEAFEGAKLAD